jgi:hypothetical protein
MVAATGKANFEGLGMTLGSHLNGSKMPIDKISTQVLYIVAIKD